MKDIIINILKVIILVIFLLKRNPKIIFLLTLFSLLIWGFLYLEQPWKLVGSIVFIYFLFMLIKKLLKKYAGPVDPIYRLQWYMIIGETGSGKTKAIKNTKLFQAIPPPAEFAEISKKLDFHWYLFENSIIIDTSGRYVVKKDTIKDNNKWRSFIKLLAKYKKQESIQGLIVTISADKLLESDTDFIQNNGISVHKSIQELIYRIRGKIPVYVLVTKCDLIHGMTQFCEYLPEDKLKQAIGYLNNGSSKDVNVFLNKAINKITSHLIKLRSFIAYDSGFSNSLAAPFFFPEEFRKTENGLKIFFNTAFKKNIYQQTPVLRGIYFASSKQTGTSCSRLINNLNIKTEKYIHDTEKSLFLHDFFSKILFRDKNFFIDTTQQPDKQKNIVNNIRIAVWITFIITLSAVLSYSFTKNRSIIKQTHHYLANPVQISEKLETNLNTIESIRKLAIEVEAKNKSILTNLGLNQSTKIEQRLKTIYSSILKKHVLTLYDKKMGNRVINFHKGTKPEIIAQNIPHIVRQINIIADAIQGKNIDQLKKRPKPNYSYLLSKSSLVVSFIYVPYYFYPPYQKDLIYIYCF